MAKARDYDKEYREYHSKPEQRRRNDGFCGYFGSLHLSNSINIHK